MSKGVKKLVKSKVPNLSRFDDVSDFLLRYIFLEHKWIEMELPLSILFQSMVFISFYFVILLFVSEAMICRRVKLS